MHPRKAIRKALEVRLKAVNTAASDRVYASRVMPIDDEEIYKGGPAIAIYTRDQKNYKYGVHGEDDHFKSDLFVVTEGFVAGGETVDDKLDDLAEQIEAAFDDWDIPGFETASLRISETSLDLVTENFRRPLGAVGITWEICFNSPWRIQPEGTRPDDVSVIINGLPPEKIIVDDKGPPTTEFKFGAELSPPKDREFWY